MPVLLLPFATTWRKNKSTHVQKARDIDSTIKLAILEALATFIYKTKGKMRKSEQDINPSLKKQIIATLAQVISDLKDREDTLSFFKDFFSEAELETLAKRIAVAYWLKKGRSYANIRDNLKVSSATIADVSSHLNGKGFGGALKRLEAEEWANQWAQKIKNFTKKMALFL